MNFLISIILFAQLTTPYESRVFVSDDGNFLIYARYYQGNLVGIDSITSISEYLSTGLLKHNKKLLQSELQRDMAQKGGYASKGLFGTFEIPLPKGGFSEFMGETGKLDVGGHVKITLGGSETFLSNLPGTSRPSLLPELEMKQEMSINLDGQVGDRMRVFIDHNSERIQETKNKITVTYMGREDEIIQEIEGGDTQLSIPATTYTGDIPSHHGLFGIKSTAKIGPLELVAIASKEQTQTQEIEIEGTISAEQDTIWARRYERRRFFWLGTSDSIIALEVYVDDNNGLNNNIGGVTFHGEAFLDIDDDNIPDDTSYAPNYKEGDFDKKLQGSGEYYLFNSFGNIIELNYNLPSYYVLGVKYKKIVNGDTVEVGSLHNDTIQLKLICPELPDTLSYTWNYEWKNYYQIISPGSRLDSLRIYYITPGGEHKDRNNDNIPFVQVLGLDDDNDGMLDENRVYFPGRGLLIFPEPEPFASNNLDNPSPEIYRDLYMYGRGKYYLYKKTMEAKPIYMLPENVVKVRVYVDEILQDSIADYYVDYEEGRLEFKKPIPPTSRVRIMIEYAPFFSAAQKSLVGIRGNLRPFGDAILGSSFFYRTESYPAEHVRLKEEPFNRIVWEADFSLPQALPFLSKFVDLLPLVETEAESRLNLNFEGAYSFSNLNSFGEVYLDDLESATIISHDISISRITWMLGSRPVSCSTANFVHERLIWYNPQDEARLKVSDIYIDPLDENEIADVLKLIFKPSDTLSFGGLTQYIYGKNLDECENLEVIVNGQGGRIHIDIAQEIDEDQLRRDRNGVLVGFGTMEDEDRNPMNGTWNEQNEDTGLDGVYGDDDDALAGDDGNDDFEDRDYTGGINGTEENRLWDTEDLDRNGVLNGESRYYSYTIDLDSTRFLVENAGLKNGWKMFRIPIRDSLVWDTVINQPDWHNIRYIRIWLDHFAQTETLLIYDVSITGSRWKNLGIEAGPLKPDSTEIFTITPVNTKTHSYYQSPYDLEKDPLTGQYRSEGALELGLENIKEGHTCIAHRRTDANEDYRAYDTLTFYLNAQRSNPLISIRIGSDSLNYYEYTTEYENGDAVRHGYRLFKISFQQFLNLKQISQGQGTISDSIYTVVGNPSLSINQFFEIRIKNQFVTPLTDTIWFNDIKLISPKTEVGRILRGSGSINFADLASFSMAFDESNGRFKRLSESKDISTQSAGRSYSIGSSISFDKFLPESWHFHIPVSLNYRKSINEPRFSYLSNDLEITEEERKKQIATSVMKSYTLHISKSNSKNWFLKHTLDRLVFNHDQSNSFSRSARNCDTSRVITYNATYSLDPRFSFKIFNQTISVLPQNVSFSALYTDNLSRSYYRPHPDSVFELSTYGSQQRKTLNPSFSVAYSPHSILTTNFNFSQSRDSVSEKRKFGEEVGRNQTFNATLAKDLKIISPRLTFSSTYNEDYRFEIRQDQDFRNVSNSGRFGINGTVNIKDIVKFFTKLRDESRDSLNTAGSPAWVAQQIEKFINYIQNPQFSFSRQRSSSYLNVKARPSLEYQWGLVDSMPAEDIALGSYPGRGLSDIYNVTSGMNFKVISLQVGYNRQINRTFNYDFEARTDNFSFPNANLRLSRVELLPFLKKLIRSSSINSAFNQSVERRYEIVADSAHLTSDSKIMSFSPLISWQSNWVKGISSTVSITYSETNSNDYAGITVVPSKSLNRGISSSLAYTFSAPRGISLPFLSGVKFASNLSVNLTVGYNRSTSYFADLRNPRNDSSILSANLGISYNFSSSISGGANFDYSQNKEMNSNQDSRRVGLNIWTNINF